MSAKRIVLASPVEGQIIGTTVVVSGRCDTYEGNVQLRVRDSRGRVLARGYGTGGTLGRMGAFDTTLTLENSPTTETGMVEAFEVDMKDGSERETVTVNIRFREG